MAYSIYFGVALHTQADTTALVFDSSGSSASAFAITQVNMAETVCAVAAPDSSASVYLVLPPVTFTSSTAPATGFELYGVAALTFASAAAAESWFATQMRFGEALRARAAAASGFSMLLAYVLGDVQQPLPESGLALTMGEASASDGRYARRTYPAAFYDNYPFTSFAILGGVAYATGPGGLYALEGGAETFTARINLGRRDYGSRLRKVIRQVGVARTAGVAHVVVAADAGTDFTYPVNAQRGAGRMERALVGRGLIGSTHEVEVRGDEALAIEEVEVLVDAGSRR